jgi:chromosomal replication initiation ATPase DnaA
MLEGTAKDILNPLEKGKGTGIIGKENFIEKIRKQYCIDDQSRDTCREQPALRKLDKIIMPEDLIYRYSQLAGLGVEALTKKGKQSTERAMLMEMLYRLCNITQPEIGKLLGGIDYSAVSQARKRLYAKMQDDPALVEKFKQTQEKITKMSRVKI